MIAFNKAYIFGILLLVQNGCHSERFYCRPTGTRTISIGRSSNTRQPDYLLIEEEFEPELSDSPLRSCRWGLELDATTPRQLVISVIPRSSLLDNRQKRSISNSTSTTFQLSGSAKNQHTNEMKQFFTLSEKTFILRSLRPEDHLIILTDLPHEEPLVSIAVSPIDPGYCAQDMVLHNGQCHVVIEKQKSSLSEAMEIISNSSSAGLQLASFSSVEEIRTFVKSNYEPEFNLPLKQPLDLTKPLRIGLFYSSSSNSVYKYVATVSGCEMRLLPNSVNILSAAKSLDGPCGALQASNSESSVILFVSCDQRMPSLISFPETPENVTCTDCNRKIREWLGGIRHPDLPIKFGSLATIVSFVCCASVLVIFASIGLLKFKIRCKKSPAIPDQEQTALKGV